jgi:hypothetical protein
MRRGQHVEPGARKSRGGVVRLLRGREDAFALALLVQVAAFVVAPGLHLINHRPDHTHGPGGVAHTHHSAPLPDGKPSPAPFHDGQGSTLHFGVALAAAQVFCFAVAIALVVAAQLWIPARRFLARALFDVAAPRGPPVAI